MRRLPEIVLVATSLAALFVLTYLVRTLDVSAAGSSGWDSFQLPSWLSPRVPFYYGGPLQTVPPGVLLGGLAAGAVAAAVSRLAGRGRVPAGLLLALALVLLAGTVLGETLRLGRALDPARAGTQWWPDRRILDFPLASYAFGRRLALGLGFPSGLVLGVFLAIPWTGLPEPRVRLRGGWLRGLGALALVLAVAGLADGTLRSMQPPGPGSLSADTRILDGIRGALGRFLALWALGLTGLLSGWLREAGLLTRSASGRVGGWVDRGRAAAAGLLGAVRGPYLVLLGILFLWAMTLAGEPGAGQFPRRLVPGVSFAAGFCGVVLLLSALVIALLAWPGRTSAPWPTAESVLTPLADGAYTAIFGCLAAGALPLLLLVGELRRRR